MLSSIEHQTQKGENIGFNEVKIIKKYKIKIEKYGYKIPHFLIIGYK